MIKISEVRKMTIEQILEAIEQMKVTELNELLCICIERRLIRMDTIVR